MKVCSACDTIASAASDRSEHDAGTDTLQRATLVDDHSKYRLHTGRGRAGQLVTTGANLKHRFECP